MSLRPRPLPLLVVLAAAAGLVPAPAAAHEARLPLEGKKVSVSTDAGKPAKDKFSFQSEKGQAPLHVDHDPQADGFRVLVVGDGGGANHSALAVLDPSLWKPIGKASDPKGWKYKDKKGSRGGVTSVLLDKKKGVLKIKAKGEAFGFSPDAPQSEVWIHVNLEDEWYCAEFGGDVQKSKPGLFKARKAAAPGACPEQVCGNGVQEAGEACDDGNLVPDDGCANDCTLSSCSGEAFPTTFAAIQSVIFDGYGCDDPTLCHGQTDHESGLVLLPSDDASGLDSVLQQNYDALLNAAPTSAVGFDHFVVAGDSKTSLLYAALFKKLQCGGPNEPAECASIGSDVQGMPEGATLQPEELEAIDLWLRGGAPFDKVVAGTAERLSACLPPAEPLKIDPPAAPGAGNGIQLRSSAWWLPAESENEICFPTYYDVSGLVPQDQQFDCPAGVEFGALNDTGKCFYWHRQTLWQDPQSHHSIIHLYLGSAPLQDPAFQPWTFKDDPDLTDLNNGPACDPTDIDPATGENENCSGKAVRSAACLGYGPSDFNTATTARQFSGSQETYYDQQFHDGVYAVMPVKGLVVWNSHAFNLTQTNTTMAQYLNLWFAGPNDRSYPAQQIFDADQIFIPDVPPFEKREYCSTYVIPQGADLFWLSSHTHRHGIHWRTWGPPNASCNPGAACNPVCDPGDAGCSCNPGGTCAPPGPSGNDRLLYLSTVYNDPVQLEVEPTMNFASGSTANDRRFLFCSLFDNGSSPTSPDVKRRSTSPTPPLPIGGPCNVHEVACMDGPHKGQPCGLGTCTGGTTPGASCQGNGDCSGAGAQCAFNPDDSFCDTTAGAGDGVCDACPLKGGFTTEDEMFILLGNYYVPTP
jgi:cysteine-rich repeat protein